MSLTKLRRAGAAVVFIVSTLAVLSFAQNAIAQTKDWKAEWDRTVAAAKKEGGLIISAPSGGIWRDQLAYFNKDYPEIKLEITPGAGPDFWARVVKEREAGQYLWDIRLGGPVPTTYRLKDEGALVEVPPLLLLPEVADESKWTGGFKGMYLDKEKKFFPSYALYASRTVYYNSKFISPDQAPTIAGLTDPQWVSKISMADPRGGAAFNMISGMLKAYGEDKIKKLIIDQKPVMSNDPRQQMNWLVSGRYPIAFGMSPSVLVEYAQKGGSIDDLKMVDGLPMWAPGTGGIQIPTKGPHPNATTVFVNWLLTPDVQSRLMAAIQLNSRRNDIPVTMPDIAVDVDHLSDYIGTQGEEIEPYGFRANEILREILK
jgi:ABC-type Fe3+ transport system substrate-binding protein